MKKASDVKVHTREEGEKSLGRIRYIFLALLTFQGPLVTGEGKVLSLRSEA